MLVRINGALPDIKTCTNTSCSVFDIKQNEVFHILVDAGNRLTDSIKQGASELVFSRMPDAILITHAQRPYK